MSEAPERIWAWWDDEYDTGLINTHGDKRYTPEDAREYVRADRIAELEAKLATCRKYRDAYTECDRISTHALRKAVEALDEAVYLLDPDEKDMMRKAGVYRIVTTLAELSSVSCANLKGETDE